MESSETNKSNAGIKPVSYIWQRLLEENRVPLDGTVVEVAPGYEKKIGDALALMNFTGTVILIEPDRAAADHVERLYREIMPRATVRAVAKPLQDVEIGRDIPLRVDALLANHPFDDMALAFAVSEKHPSFFSEEREDGTNLTDRIRELYDTVTDKRYIHGVLATIVAWKDFIQRLKPMLFMASQYPSNKLAMKKLTKRQNSGFIVIELLRNYYENYLKEQYQDKSFGRQGDPAWWIIARKPYVDLASDLAERPAAMKRLGRSVFVPERARRLDDKEYDIIYTDAKYFRESGYIGDILEQSRNLAIVLDHAGARGEKITVYSDRQQDATGISLGGNIGSGRAVYYGKRHNVMGVGKTALCTSAIPSHSTGKMELVGSLRRVILSRWINHFTKSSIGHLSVMALKETARFKWSPNPIPLALLARVDDGALDRPSHVEYSPAIEIDFDGILSAYAKLDAQYFAYRIMMGAWSTGNYSLDGRMIDIETASFVKHRGPYNTASTKYHQNFFGYEGSGFVIILEQLAGVKKIKTAGLQERFYGERRKYLAFYFLTLLGVHEGRAAVFLSKHGEKVAALSDQFEKLSKKIGPEKTSLSLYGHVPDGDDPSLLDMSNLFRNLAKLRRSPSGRERKALDCLVRKTALAKVRSGVVYEPETAAGGKINDGEVFIKEKAVITHDRLEEFLSEAKEFVRGVFLILDDLEAERCLPEGSYWDDELKAVNQDFPTLGELNDKLKYWVEEYRSGRIGPETLGLEVEKLCQLPHYPTGENFDFRDIPLIDYLRPNRRELGLLSRHLKPVVYDRGEIIVREGDEADSLFVLVQGACRIVVGGVGISRVGDRGSLIGEAVVLEKKKKRTATVIAETQVRLLKITGTDLRKMKILYPAMKRLLANMLTQRRAGITDRIRGLEIFAGVNPEDVRLFFADKGSEKTFRPGEKIVSQGKKAAGIHVLIRGSVVLSQSGEISGLEPIELTDGPLKEGLFGERSVILDQGAVCAVTANEDVATIFVGGDDFRELIDRYPQLLRNCLDHISDYSKANDDRGSLISKLEKKLQDNRE
jgi:CRP-like cAMP-binding protein